MRSSLIISAFLLQSLVLVLANDPYTTLGLSRGADINQIKKAYKRLARKWHPDRNKDDGAQNRFVEVSTAYEILSDPEKRDSYDRYGRVDVPQNSFPGGHSSREFRMFRTSDGGFYFYGDPFENGFFHEQRSRSMPLPLSTRIWTKLGTLPKAVWGWVSREFVSVILSLLGIAAVAVWVKYVDADRGASVANESADSGVPKQPEKYVHEMNVQRYYGLLRGQTFGCRTIVVLVDTETKPQLIRSFTEIVRPYKNHKSLTFAYLNLDKYSHWYEALLENSDARPERGRVTINVKQTRASVLVLNNKRLCFSVFHAEISNIHQDDDLLSELESDEPDVENGVYHGKGRRRMDTGERSSEPGIGDGDENRPVSLHGLGNWLERVFDGQITKVPISSWPPLTTAPLQRNLA